MTQIKICGLRTVEDVLAVNEYNPDYVGFIFVKDRKRYVDPIIAKGLKEKLNPQIKTVGVFINEPIEDLRELESTGVMDLIQLHGSEDNDYISEVRNFTQRTIIKAIRVESKADVEKAEKCAADIILFDCGIGGTGKSFDWSLIENFKRPFFLAGGLGTENIPTALKLLHPMGVDVSSKVETDGKKDKDKIEKFINTVRKEDEKND